MRAAGEAATQEVIASTGCELQEWPGEHGREAATGWGETNW